MKVTAAMAMIAMKLFMPGDSQRPGDLRVAFFKMDNFRAEARRRIQIIRERYPSCTLMRRFAGEYSCRDEASAIHR